MITGLNKTPFFLLQNHKVVCYDVEGDILPDDFQGVIYDCTTKKFWYFGRDNNERSFHVLDAKDFDQARHETRKKYNFHS